jgi:hypothetical protein
MTHQINNINISYDINEFMKYKELNYMLPPNLKPFCNDIGGNVYFRDGMVKEVGAIIDTFMNGRNPNDILFKNSIVEALNNITQRNYQTVITNLKSLNFSKTEHFTTLASDLLICAMTDITGVKGINVPQGQISSSEIFVLVASDFFPLIITDNNKVIKFSSVFLELCKRHFDDFCDPIKPLDHNNLYRVDNFKGFTNFLGLLYSKGLINSSVVTTCLQRLVTLIYNTSWGQTESENVYEGYRRIINNLLKSLEGKSKEDFKENDMKFLLQIQTIHSEIQTKNKTASKLRRFTMMYHDENDKRIQKLIQTFTPA